jgi:DNA modification methylase
VDSGPTGLACLRTGLRFIGIEMECRWFAMACERLGRWVDQ